MSLYRAHLYNRTPREPEPSALARGVWATIKLTAFIAVAGAGGWLLFHHYVQSKLARSIEQKCNCALGGSGIETSIGDAKFFEGQGILLSNLHSTTKNISLSAYQTFLSMSSNTADLVTGNCNIIGIEMRRVQLDIFHKPGESIDFSALAKLAEAIGNADPQNCQSLIPISLMDSRIRFVNANTGAAKTISDINIRIVPQEIDGRTILEIRSTAASSEVKQVALNGFVDPDSGQWKASLTLNNALISSELIALLPAEIQQELGPIESLSGRVAGYLSAEGNWKTDIVNWFDGKGNIGEVNLKHPQLPSAITNASAEFQLSPEGITCDNISGYLGNSPFAARFHFGDIRLPMSWKLVGRLDRFRLDESASTLCAMPASAHQFLADFRPRGMFDLQFEFAFDGKRIRKTIDAKISDLAFNFNKFPYPMSNCFGTARWVDDVISYDLRNETRDRILTATGTVNNPGKSATWTCNIQAEKGHVPIDEKLQTAINANASMGRVVKAFNAHGWIGGSGTLQKLTPGGMVQKRFDIDVVNVSLRHERFLYTIENVNGKIRSVNKSFRFENLAGDNGVGTIVCNGIWNPKDGLNVRYQCNQIPLDQRLRYALRPELKDVWDGFRPQGTVEKMIVDMTMAPQEKVANVVVNATLNGENNGIRTSNLSIYPTWFPYELSNLAGELAVGNGKVQLRNFQGQHGRTRVVCNGDGSYSRDGWDMRLSDLLTLALRADQPLLRALPESLARPIQYMKFDGLLNVKGTMTLAGQYRKPKVQFANHPAAQRNPRQQRSFVQQASATVPVDPEPNSPKVSMGWDLRFDMNQAEMFLGIPVRNVFGMFKLIGQYDGENVECRGSVDLDSLTIYDAQVTKVRGPVWFDNYQALAGGTINQLSSGRTPTPSITGEMYGGLVQLDAAISSDKEGRFIIQTTLADGDLRQLSQEFSPGLKDIEGRTFAALTMQGNASGTHTCRGNGQIHLRDAKIYELPPVMRLLKLLRPGIRIDDVAFDSGDMFFVVNGENIDVNRMEFNGDAISIIGNGRITTNHDLDLNFYSVMGRNRVNIPLISDLYRRGSQKFMWINVGGTCQDPKISKEILPELNDSLRQLFRQDE